MTAAMNRMIARRRVAAKQLLGGVCVVCGTTDNLDFDHKDPATKSFNIASNWGRKWSETLSELEKCQLLCRKHHIEKSAANLDAGIVIHGGGNSGKRNCPCDLCRSKKREYMKRYMQVRRRLAKGIQTVKESV